jgi:hypothetical protein
MDAKSAAAACGTLGLKPENYQPLIAEFISPKIRPNQCILTENR